MAAHHVEGLEDAEAALVNDGYDVVRVGYSDLIGSERGRDVLVRGFARTVGDGSPSAAGSTARPPWGEVSRSRAA